MKKFGLIVLGLVVLQSSLSSQIQKVRVGQTPYDLQTNNSVARRVVIDPTTGELAITYTGTVMSETVTNNNYPSRGTGYFYYAGAGAITPVTGFPGRIESQRVGWGAPMFLANGKEFVISHVASTDGTLNGLYSAKRGKIGTGTWSEKAITGGLGTWPRAANSGDSIFVISTVTNSSDLFGMKGGLGFKRSYDGGSTWTPSESGGLDSIPGLNSATYPNKGTTTLVNVISADDYALDVKGKRVAILTGGLDVTLFLSSDFGNTWSKTTILQGDNNTNDTLEMAHRQASGFSVLIDNNGKVHCFWGASLSNNYSVSFLNGGIAYWNNAMTEPIIIGKTYYGKENGTHALPYFSLDNVLQFNKMQNDQTNFTHLQNNYGGGVSHSKWPNAGVDASNTIYMSYARIRGVNDSTRINLQDMATIDPAVDKILDIEGELFYDVYIIKSTDGGSNWIGPLNVSNNDSMEDVFPSIARTVNTHVHLAYQQDSLSGTGAAGNTSTFSHKATSTVNDIIYAKIPVGDITMQSDNLPPLIRIKRGFFDKFNHPSYDVTSGDTFRFEIGCKKELSSSLDYTNALEFASKYIVEAMDDVSDQNLIRVDTAGLNFGVAGTYKFLIYAKDASNKNSEIQLSAFSPSTKTSIDKNTAYHSWDTFKFYIKVAGSGTDVTPPTFSWGTASKVILWLQNTPFTDADRPMPVAVTDNNPCAGTPPLVKPASSLVNTSVIGKYILPYSATDASGNTARDTVVVYVGQKPTPVLSDVSFESTSSTKGNIYASAQGSDNTKLFSEYPDTYKWTFKAGSSLVSALSTTSTKDTIIKPLPFSNTNKSVNTVCVSISNAFTSKFGTTPETCTTFKNTLGVTSATSKDFQVEIYPNPSNGDFDIKIAGAGVSREVNIKISDIMGKKVLDGAYRIGSDGVVHIQGSHFVKGHYVIQTEVGNYQSNSLIEIR